MRLLGKGQNSGVFAPLFYVLWGFGGALAHATDWLEIPVASQQAWQQLRTLLSDVEAPRAGVAVAYASSAEQAALRAAGFAFTLKIADLEAYYAQRAQHSRRENVVGSMGGFRTFAEIEAELERLQQTYPQCVSHKFPIGYSLEGRPLWALLLSDNPHQYEPDEPIFWLDGLHHAREAITAEVVLRFADWLARQYSQDAEIARLLHTRQILLLPCLNPDGYVYNQQQTPNGGGIWRKNRRINADGSVGVDLNRNYGWFWGQKWSGTYDEGSSSITSDIDYRGTAAFSEPETQAVRDAWALVAPKIAVTLHSYGQEWMYPWGYTATPADDAAVLQQYAVAMADPSFTVGNAWQLYGITNGAADDYFYGQHQAFAFTVEIGTPLDGFWPAPARIPALFEQVRPGLLKAAQWSGAWAEIDAVVWQETTPVGAANRQMHSGETWQATITLKNQGRESLNAVLAVPSCLPLESTCRLQQQPIRLEPQQSQTLAPVSLTLTATAFAQAKPLFPALLSSNGEYRLLHVKLPLTTAQAQLPEALSQPLLLATGKPQAGETLTLSVHSRPAAEVFLFAAEQLSNNRAPSAEVDLAPPLYLIWQATTDATGTAQWQVDVPADHSWAGVHVMLQAVIVDAYAKQATPVQDLTFN